MKEELGWIDKLQEVMGFKKLRLIPACGGAVQKESGQQDESSNVAARTSRVGVAFDRKK